MTRCEPSQDCAECKREFPSRLLAPFRMGNCKPKWMCPLCALRIRNQMHSLPADTPFQGEQASAMYDEAKQVALDESRKEQA